MTENGKKIETVAVAGLGLIGASLALALKPFYNVVGCDSNKTTEEYALKNGVVNEIRPLKKFAGVSCVFVCTPLYALEKTVREAVAAVGNSAVVTDVGSVKRILNGIEGRIVGGHPMAGTERSGIEAAKPHLFENATYCVVPYENSRQGDVEYVKEIARKIKAKPLVLSADEHDRLAAYYSHMPHLAAYALAGTALGNDSSVAGSGFMDSTRIACSDARFWAQVCKLNGENVLRALGEYIDGLADLRELLKRGEYEQLENKLREASEKRKILSAARGYVSDLTLCVDIKDEVGSIGAVVSLLMGGGVNIANLRILDSREGVGGALMLAFETRRDCVSARNTLIDAGYSVS